MTTTLENTATLALCFNGMLQSYGVKSSTDYRDTANMPQKSAVIGMICRARGLEFAYGNKCEADNDTMRKLERSVRFGVRDDSIGGEKIKEFYTARQNGEAYVGNKEVLVGKQFMVFLQGKRSDIEEISDNFMHPQKPLSWGRARYLLNGSEVIWDIDSESTTPGVYPGTIEDLLIDENFDSQKDNKDNECCYDHMLCRPMILEKERNPALDKHEAEVLSTYYKNHPNLFKPLKSGEDAKFNTIETTQTRPIEFSRTPVYAKLELQKINVIPTDCNTREVRKIERDLKSYLDNTIRKISVNKSEQAETYAIVSYVGTYNDKKNNSHDIVVSICKAIDSEQEETKSSKKASDSKSNYCLMLKVDGKVLENKALENVDSFIEWVKRNVSVTEHIGDREELKTSETLYSTVIDIEGSKRGRYLVRTRNNRIVHGILSDSFKRDQDNYLFFVDRANLYVHMLSAKRPNVKHLSREFEVSEDSICVMETKHSFVDGQELSFTLNANPVARHNSKDTVIKDDKGLNEWLVGKARENGFELNGFEFSHEMSIKGKNNCNLNSVIYYGTLKVTDAKKFHEAVVSGIGRSKSSGFGMMLLEQI